MAKSIDSICIKTLGIDKAPKIVKEYNLNKENIYKRMISKSEEKIRETILNKR